MSRFRFERPEPTEPTPVEDRRPRARPCPRCGRPAHVEGSTILGCRRFLAEFLLVPLVGTSRQRELDAECEAAGSGKALPTVNRVRAR